MENGFSLKLKIEIEKIYYTFIPFYIAFIRRLQMRAPFNENNLERCKKNKDNYMKRRR